MKCDLCPAGTAPPGTFLLTLGGAGEAPSTIHFPAVAELPGPVSTDQLTRRLRGPLGSEFGALTNQCLFVCLEVIFFMGFGRVCLHWLFSSCGEQELLSSCNAQAPHCSGFSCCGAWTLCTWASVAPLEHRISSSGVWARLLCGMWDLPGSWIEPVSLVLAGRFFTTNPSGKPSPPVYEHVCCFQFQ